MSLVDRVRQALRSEPALPPLEGDLPEERAIASVPAAVLIGITDRQEPGVILTVRREHMRTHAGQIAFPGGRLDPGEDETNAALR
jgi:8-oxo-dGTP pyrophosphatase MutT (NUDIX family)